MLDSVTTAASAVMFQVGGDIFYDADNQLYTGEAKAGEPGRRQEPGREAGVGHLGQDGRREHHRQDRHVVDGVERRLQERHLRRDVLPVLDDRHRARTTRAPRTRASGTSPPFLVAPATGVARGSRVPTQSKYPEEAAKLAAFLTNAPARSRRSSSRVHCRPTCTALQNPDFQATQNAYFNNAPTGKIFGEQRGRTSSRSHLGPKHGSVKERAFEPALQAYEGGQAQRGGAWEQFLKDVPIQGSCSPSRHRNRHEGFGGVRDVSGRHRAPSGTVHLDPRIIRRRTGKDIP